MSDLSPAALPIHISRDVGSQLIRFVHYLRASKFDVSTRDTLQMGQVLKEMNKPDLQVTRSTFRALCCRNQDDWNNFNSRFNEFWLRKSKLPGGEDLDSSFSETENKRNSEARSGGGISGTTEHQNELYDPGMGATSGGGKQNSLSKADFRFLKDKSAMRKVERLAERLAQQIRPQSSRRKILSKVKGKLALQETLKASVRTAGVPFKPWFFRQRKELPRVVILHDVSHSMTFNNPLLIRFTRGLIRKLNKSEAFVFHTRISPATEIFREPTLERMHKALESNNRLWLGGTCIADSLLEFLQTYGSSLLSLKTVVIIISDGFDSNDPGHLADQLKLIGSKCRRVLWLNPMLEREGFNPEKEEVYNINRHVDYLLSAHSLAALRKVIKVIRS